MVIRLIKGSEWGKRNEIVTSLKWAYLVFSCLMSLVSWVEIVEGVVVWKCGSGDFKCMRTGTLVGKFLWLNGLSLNGGRIRNEVLMSTVGMVSVPGIYYSNIVIMYLTINWNKSGFDVGLLIEG